MAKAIMVGLEAPDFELVDTRGQKVRLSEFRGKKLIVLVLNRGFA